LFGSEKEVSRYEAMLGGLGIMVSYGFRDVIRHLREKGHQYDFVLLSFPEVAYRYLPCARAFAVNAQILYDPVDLHWVRLEREATAKGDDGARQKSEEYKKIERFNTSAADLVIAITEEEKEHLLREVPNACIEVVPNIHECVDGAKPLSGRKDLLFIGHFMHTPNEDAVSYFVKEIFPLIRRELSDVRFHIVGSSMTDGIKSLDQPGVIPVGYVPEPSDYFDRCRVFVAPLRYGAGMKGKIGQSMSFGLPVVTTSIGAEGMQVIDRKHLLIADSAEDFARAVVELCVDDRLWERLSAESLAHVKAHFSKTAVREKLAKVFAATGRDLRSDTIDPMNTQSWNGQAAVTSEDR
jgi:glycosyltransferase involved in cell wall biosynthesis